MRERPPRQLVDPYRGAIPLVSPLEQGTFMDPIADNWHEFRDGNPKEWSHSHRGSRAHDGVDLMPSSTTMPAVWAPFVGEVVAVCWRRVNETGAEMTHLVDADRPPPWDYSMVADSDGKTPLYGNFVWLRSTDAASTGFQFFVCHLQHEDVLKRLEPGQRVEPGTHIGMMGDSGNATGFPQLHVEIHYPAGYGYSCRQCHPRRRLTAMNPHASLHFAERRVPASVPSSGDLALQNRSLGIPVIRTQP